MWPASPNRTVNLVSFQAWTVWRGHIASVAERMCGYREERGNWALARNMTLKFWRLNLYLIKSNSFSRAFWVEMFSLQTSASIIDLTCIGMGEKKTWILSLVWLTKTETPTQDTTLCQQVQNIQDIGKIKETQ